MSENERTRAGSEASGRQRTSLSRNDIITSLRCSKASGTSLAICANTVTCAASNSGSASGSAAAMDCDGALELTWSICRNRNHLNNLGANIDRLL